MKKITTFTTVLMLLVLWSGLTLAAEPVPKKPATQPSGKTSPGAPQQPGSKTLTTPGVSATAAFVDLAVTEIKVQELGQGALIQVTVKNLGTTSADANLYRLRVLLDGSPLPGGELPGGELPLFNARTPIEPNQTRVTGVVPAKSGRTEVTARLIPSGAAASDNPTNNTLTRTLNLPEVLPDFTVEGLSLTADNLIQVTIRNGGGYAVREARGKLEVFVENDRVDSIAVSQWPNPRETKEITTTARIAGQRNVRATVNPDRAVREMDYQNNTLTKVLTAHAFKPDLIVKNLDRWKDLPSGRTPNRTAATRLVIVIANIGRATSPRTLKADVFRAGEILETLTLTGPIDNGTEKRFETGILVEGVREYRVTVDPLNTIDEEREDNNSRTEALQAYTQAELHPQAILYSSGEIRVNIPDGFVVRSVPCSAEWPFVRVRVKGWFQYRLEEVGGTFSSARSSASDAEGRVPLLINEVDLTPYHKAGNVYDYMLRCTGPDVKLGVRDTNYSDNKQSPTDPLRAEIFIPSGDDVRQSGLRMP